MTERAYNYGNGGATPTTAVVIPCTAAAAAASAAATPPRRAYTRLFINKEDLPDESIRQIAAANQRVRELEEEYWKSLDADEIAIERKCASGLACLKAPGMLEKAAEYYTSAAELRCVMMTGTRTTQEWDGWREVVLRTSFNLCHDRMPLSQRGLCSKYYVRY